MFFFSNFWQQQLCFPWNKYKNPVANLSSNELNIQEKKILMLAIFERNSISLMDQTDKLLDRDTQTVWLDNSQTGRLKDTVHRQTKGEDPLHIAVQMSNSYVQHSQLPEWPQISAGGLWSVTEIITKSTELTKGRADRDSAERCRDLKVIEDRISSSIVPPGLQKAEGCGESRRGWLEKMGLDNHHLDVCCKRQLDHEVG